MGFRVAGESLNFSNNKGFYGGLLLSLQRGTLAVWTIAHMGWDLRWRA